MPSQVDVLDYWDVIRNFPVAYEKRRALELLEDVSHQILIRGPEGESVHKDERGTVIKGSGSVVFTGLLKYEAELRKRAGLPDVIQDKPTEPKSKGLEALNLLSKAFGGGGV